MTVAVCVRCGSLKYGGFNPCEGCGFEPETEIDAAYSLAPTGHYFPVAVLEEISASIRSGRPGPSLPSDQEERLREACRPFLKLQQRRQAKAARIGP